MKRIAIIFLVLVFPLLTLGEGKRFEYTPKMKNKVEITNLLGRISLQNAPGNAIVIESDFKVDRPDRAEGLKLLGAMEDNTDLGINVSEENGVVSIQGATKQVRDFKYKIMIPAGMSVSLDYGSPFAGSDIAVDSYKGSLEIKTLNSNVKITNSSGPFTVNSISGKVEVVFDKINQSDPTSLASVSGLIDVSVPSTEKATFEIGSITGNVYNNLDLKSTSTGKKDDRSSGLDVVNRHGGEEFTLNGGGQKVLLKSVSGNIYLRKR